MAIKAWYKDWFNTPYYHLLYSNRDNTEATLFIEKLIGYLNPINNSTMLDVACGKGRHSKALAEMGFDVTGIDLSSASIEEAKQMEGKNLHFYEHDMRLPFWINYYHFAFNFFTSFGYFNTQREHNNTIRTIAQSMRTNGVFVIDYLNAHFAEKNIEKNSIVQLENNVCFHISKWHTENHFFKQIQVTDAKNKAPKHLYTERVAKFSLADFSEMMSYQNLQIQEVFGDYNLGQYKLNDSPRMIILAKKMK
jgi:2-polyprenyl-3-methyl-5-hydroxy-6-metoxy-1,4-benzoquinol methylase